jgi:hypothetical protein
LLSIEEKIKAEFLSELVECAQAHAGFRENYPNGVYFGFVPDEYRDYARCEKYDHSLNVLVQFLRLRNGAKWNWDALEQSALDMVNAETTEEYNRREKELLDMLELDE